MKIALLTFLDVPNFGANLQLTSTYYYLTKLGHDVVAVNYKSDKSFLEKFVYRIKHLFFGKSEPLPQNKAHHEYITTHIQCISPLLNTNRKVSNYIKQEHFDCVIIGSDAVAQHWPLFSTLRLGRKRPFWIEPLQRERRFPNPFWGTGFADYVPTGMLSVSSQNSKYKKFCWYTRKRMSEQLAWMKYISVRDGWTRDMMLFLNSGLEVNLTPDPVFAFNQNAGDLIPSESDIRSRHHLPHEYVLIGLRSQALNLSQLAELKALFRDEGKECVAFCIDSDYHYKHPFDYQIRVPLDPLEWYALIKYASAYVGSNMHPIVCSLANSVPCYSIDNWGSVDFWGHKTSQTASSKVYDILMQYGLTDYYSQIDQGKCMVSVKDIVNKIKGFPVYKVREISVNRIKSYNSMMTELLNAITK